MKSFVTHNTSADAGQAPVQICQTIPIGPSTLPVSPTAAMSQPRSGARATSK